jgi:hypothetical protein
MKKGRKIKRNKKQKGQIFALYKYIIVAIFILVLGTLALKLITSVFSQSPDGVLGSSIFLAKGGGEDSGGSNSDSGSSEDDNDDDNSGSGSSGSDSGESSDSSGGSSNSGSGSSNSGSGSLNSNSQKNSSTGGISDSTQVDCVGPDGKIFRSTFDTCKDLNEAWGNANFQFTVLSSGSNTITRVFDPKEVEIEDEDEEDEIDEVEIENELELSEEEKIKVRTKDGRTRIDITSGGVKTRLEYRDDRVIVKAEVEDGTEEELEDDALLKIEDRLSISGIRVATNGAEGFIIQRDNVGAVTEFPILIDLATNTLSINTPAGERHVAVLPDQAIENLLAANIINNLIKTQALNASEIENIEQVITLGANQGELVYQIQGISNQKLLGLLPVLIEKTVEISAESGQVMSEQEALLDRILDAISF